MELLRTVAIICLLPSLAYSVDPGHEDHTDPGIIQSPGYPRPYPKGSQYSWKFERTYGAWAVVFEDFDVEKSQDCKDDYLLIRDSSRHLVLARVCGDKLPETVYTAGHSLVISFHSDGLNEGKGFKLRVLHDKTQEALRARLSTKSTTVQTEQHDTPSIRLSSDDLLIYSLSLALLVAMLVLICLGGWTVYHHCFRGKQKSCCCCSGKSQTKTTVINMEPIPAHHHGRKYSKPRLKEAEENVPGGNNVYLPMPDQDTMDQSNGSTLGRKTGREQLPLFHTSQSRDFEEVKFIGVM